MNCNAVRDGRTDGPAVRFFAFSLETPPSRTLIVSRNPSLVPKTDGPTAGLTDGRRDGRLFFHVLSGDPALPSVLSRYYVPFLREPPPPPPRLHRIC